MNALPGDTQSRRGNEIPTSRWMSLWQDFITSGGRSTPDDPDYLRLTLMNLAVGVGMIVWGLFLCFNVLGVFESSATRFLIDVVGIVVAVSVIASLRAGAPVGAVAEVVHGLLFILLLGVAITRADNPLALTVPLIYPAIAFLLLDAVLKACAWTLAMMIGLNLTIFLGLHPDSDDWGDVIDGALTISMAMFFQAAVMALYVHNRKQVMVRLRSLSAELSYTATHDALTGLYDRRSFLDTVSRELSRRDRRLFAFLTFDIDRFKAYNDTFGHPEGDRLIQRIGAAAQSVFSRREDVVFRLGGEEFGVAYRAEDQADAAAMADRLLTAVEALGAPAPAGPRKSVTVSAGLFVSEGTPVATAEEVYRLADDALYEAKESGRARWVLAQRKTDEGPTQ